MLKKILPLLILALGILAVSCGPSKKTNDNGLEYVIYEDKEGEVPKKGQVVTLHVRYKTSKDSILRDSWKDGEPTMVMLEEPSFKGGLEEGIGMLSVGDSAEFWVSADSLFNKTFMSPLPPFIDSGSRISFTIKVLKIQDKAVFEKEEASRMQDKQKKMQEDMEKQKGLDEKMITDFLAKNGLTATRTPSGLYYAITQAGKGKNALAGNTITVHYRGKLMDGTVFDESFGKEPLMFKVGAGEVIPGWDEGLTYFNDGSKGVLVIPAHLAYGPMAYGKIPANAILVFDIEMIKSGNK